jgi:hypothetical protein
MAHRRALIDFKSKADPRLVEVLRNLRNKAKELTSS